MNKQYSNCNCDLNSAVRNEVRLTNSNRFLHRLHCVKLVKNGCKVPQVSEWFGEHTRTIQRWVKSADNDGVEGLRDNKRIGRPTSILDSQKIFLRQDVNKLPNEIGYKEKKWSGKLLKFHLENYYHVELGLRQCQRLLSDLRT